MSYDGFDSEPQAYDEGQDICRINMGNGTVNCNYDADYVLIAAEKTGGIDQNETLTYTLEVDPPEIDNLTIYFKGSIADQRDPESGYIGQQGIWEKVVEIEQQPTYTVSGNAKSDLNNYDIIAGATVMLDGGQSTETDWQGNYVFENVSEGSHVITISQSAIDWQDDAYTIQVNDDVTQDFFGHCKAIPEVTYEIPPYFTPNEPFDITVNIKNTSEYVTNVKAYLDVSFPAITSGTGGVQVISQNGFDENNPVFKPHGEPICSYDIINGGFTCDTPAEYLLVTAERTNSITVNNTWSYTLRVTPPDVETYTLHFKGSIVDQRDPASSAQGQPGQQGLYEFVETIPNVANAYSITLEPYRISNTNGTPNTASPGTVKDEFAVGETARITFKAKNEGLEVPVQTLLNIFNGGGDLVYDTYPNNNNNNPLPADGNWHYYSFDWEIPLNFDDFGQMGFGAAMWAPGDELITLYETTCTGPNTDFNCEWILEDMFSISNSLYPAVEIPIIMYHNVDDEAMSEYWVDVDDFEMQMDYLEAYGYNAVTIQDIMDYCDDGDALPPNPVAITFDDGYQNFYTHAYPILLDKGFKATNFLLTDFVAETPNGRMTNTWDPPEAQYNNPHLIWPEVIEMAQNDIAFPSHTKSHPKLSELNQAELVDELVTSKQIITDHLGVCDYFSYPFGDYNPNVVNTVFESGYLAACDIDRDGSMFNTETSYRFLMERLYVPSYMDINWFAQKIDPDFELPDIDILSVEFYDENNNPKESFMPGETVKTKVHFENNGATATTVISLNLDDDYDTGTPPVYDSHLQNPSEDITVNISSGEDKTVEWEWVVPEDATLGEWFYNVGFHGQHYILWYGGTEWQPAFDVTGTYSINMELYKITDTSGEKHTDDPGNESNEFIPGETVRITFEVTNIGTPAEITAVCNVRDANDESWPYDSHTDGGDVDATLNIGETKYFSFDWQVPDGYEIFGNHDIGGSIRGQDNFESVLETTCVGPNSGWCGDEWIIPNIFSVLENSLYVEFISGPSGTINYNEITFTWEGHDNNGYVVGYEYKIDGLGFSTVNNYINIPDQLPGNHIFEVRCIDNEGNYSAWIERNYEISFTSPPASPPYPIIFVHGWAGAQTSFAPWIDFINENDFGWKNGNYINVCLDAVNNSLMG